MAVNVTGCESKKAQEDYRTENYHYKELGDKIYVFSPDDEVEKVQAILDELWQKQETNQFGEERYCVYFLPGEYDSSLSIKVGYYMQVAGLGYLPDDTSIPELNCDARWLGDDSNHNATCNFWRGVENLKIGSNTVWAVSQATFMRRVHIEGALHLHDDYGWASGGFLSDSVVDLATDSGSQQQWLSRNCDWKAWIGDNWNMVFAGIEPGKAPVGTWPAKQFTTVDEVEEIREKPFMVFDEKEGLGVFIPNFRTQAVGVSWQKNGENLDKEQLDGKFIPLSEFYVAMPEKDTSQTLNDELKKGKNLFFTPGIYELDQELLVENEGTIILGTGLATLRPISGNACIHVTASDDIVLSGILFDAGTTEAAVLLQVGEQADATEQKPEKQKNTNADMERSATVLSDLFFRVGGAIEEAPASVDTCIEINSSHVIGDNFWVWRADHGAQVGWDLNTARNGLVVNGDDVTIYALMVEHFQEYQTIWRGNEGKVIMYQSEIPYDVPNQDEFKSHEGAVNGYASYCVEDEVETHEAWGIGIYSYNRDAVVEIFSAMEVPKKPGVKIHNVCAIMITGNPGITHVVNDEGKPCYRAGTRQIITEYIKK
ncbi:MAG: coagulation factor 5/8 type domain-containing protein [Firmicutes bacterium]|nr:coagulation factor 5/8 type domain-containing protein [Bacillota bacterium]